jgi:hypothetical protein
VVDPTAEDGVEGVELLRAAVDAPADTDLTDDAVADDDGDGDETPTADEWADLRSVLAGDDPGGPEVDDDDDDDDVAEAAEEFLASWADGDDEADPLAEEVAELVDRVQALTEALEHERAERRRLAEQLDRVAAELDEVLNEALDEERARRHELEDSVRQVQEALAAAPTYDGPERRSGVERRVSGDRRRVAGRRERPLRARDFTPEPEPAPTDEVGAGADGDERPSLWKSRLNEVAGSVSAWSSDDIQRLRTD